MSRLKVGAALMAATVALVGAWEGLRTVAYRDPVGIPTVCFGETRGVKMGDKYTVEQCKAMLGERLVEFEMGIRRCLVSPDTIPDATYTAMISLSYNIGVGAFCKSSIVKKWNTGDSYGACNAFALYNKAGGRVVQGLVNRRKAERKQCVAGLSEPVTIGDPEATPPDKRPVLRRGSAGLWVEHLQTKLGLDVDGKFGPATADTVMAFQKAKGLVVDGVVGAKTWEAIAK